MKVYVVIMRTMENSPDVRIVSVTTSKAIANEKLKQVEAEVEEWMRDTDDDSSNWADAAIGTAKKQPRVKPGDKLTIVTITEWIEDVDTEIVVLPDEPTAKGFIADRKKFLLEEDPDLLPFDEDETLEESMHLCDESIMADYYFNVETVTVE